MRRVGGYIAREQWPMKIIPALLFVILACLIPLILGMETILLLELFLVTVLYSVMPTGGSASN